MFWYLCLTLLLMVVLCPRTARAQDRAVVDDTEAEPDEWGFRPADGSRLQVAPPGFCWRPQEGAVSYEVQCARDGAFSDVEYGAGGIAFNVHCPPRTLPAGDWHWRFRFTGQTGEASEWSRTRAFTIAEEARELPLPVQGELLDDGGWHEGMSYWRSYIQRFTWWADVMRVAMGIDAFQKPYFSQIGHYPLYQQPPGTTGGGLRTDGEVGAATFGADGEVRETFAAGGGSIEVE